MFKHRSTLIVWPILALVLGWCAVEQQLERRVEFHTGSGRQRHVVLLAGYPLSDRSESTSITRMAGSESWPGRWVTCASDSGVLVRGISCYRHGQVPSDLRSAALILEMREPDPARRRELAQQVMRCAQAGDFERIREWLKRVESPEQRNRSLTDVAVP